MAISTQTSNAWFYQWHPQSPDSIFPKYVRPHLKSPFDDHLENASPSFVPKQEEQFYWSNNHDSHSSEEDQAENVLPYRNTPRGNHKKGKSLNQVQNLTGSKLLEQSTDRDNKRENIMYNTVAAITTTRQVRVKQAHKGKIAEKHQSSYVNYLPWFMSISLLQPYSTPNSYNVNNPKRELIIEKSGPLNIFYQWNQLDFDFPTEEDKEYALNSENYIPDNNLPLGLDVWEDRLFITIPRWKSGVTATLSWVPKIPIERSPKLKPYPDWNWHDLTNSCDDILTSVFRISVDSCGRLWALDSGQVDITVKLTQMCPPSIAIFDLYSDQLIRRHILPEEFVKQDSLFTNIAVDVRDGKCKDAFAYVVDVWRYGIVVYSYKTRKSWRLTHGLFYPEPFLTKYQLGDLTFRWNDGIFGIALSPHQRGQSDRTVFFHPMSGANEFYIKASALQNETYFDENDDAIKLLGESRGANGQSSASAMDRNGVLFYNMVSRNSLSCWNSNRGPYRRSNFGVVEHNNVTMVFPNDLKVDNEARQSVWLISNKLPFFIYRKLDYSQINFRIFQGYTDEIIKNTPCDLNYPSYPEFSYYENCP